MPEENKVEKPVLWHVDIPDEARDSFTQIGGRKLSIVAFGIKRASQFTYHPNNYSIHPKSQQRAVEGSLASLGWVDVAIESKESGFLVDGHERIWNALQNGDGYVPYIQVDLTEAEEAQAILTIDPTVQMKGVDRDKMKSLMLQVKEAQEEPLQENVQEFLSGLADDNRIENPFEEPKPADPGADLNRAEELQKKWGVQVGQLFKLGEHRLVCGDCTDEAVIVRLMDGEKAEIIFTDPPYKFDMPGGGCFGGENTAEIYKEINNADLMNFEPSGFLETLHIYFEKGIHSSFIFCNKELLPNYLNWALLNKINHNVLVWHKDKVVPFGFGHVPDIEYIVFMRKNATWNNGTRANRSKVLNYSIDNEIEGHPTPKPTELTENELILTTTKGRIVADPFLGSGTTLIACERLNRKCFGIEIDPSYCSVVLERFFEMTNIQPELIEE